MPRARLTDVTSGRQVVISFEGEPPTAQEQSDIMRSVFGDGRLGAHDLPAIGGLIGGVGGAVAGAPSFGTGPLTGFATTTATGAAGAALGGGIGEGVRQAFFPPPKEVGLPDRRFQIISIPEQGFFGRVNVEGAPQGFAERAKAIAVRGGEEGLLDLVTAPLGLASQTLGRGAQRLAMNPSGDLRIRNPNIITDSLRLGGAYPDPASVSRIGEKVDASKRASDRIAASASESGEFPIDIQDASRRAAGRAEEFSIKDAATGSNDARTLQKRLERLEGLSGNVDVSEGRQLQKVFSDDAAGAYKASEAGNRTEDANALISRDLARSVKEQTEAATGGALDVQNRNTMRLRSVQDLARGAVGGRGIGQMGLGAAIGSGATLAAGGDPTTALLVGGGMAAATSPPVSSRIGSAAFRMGSPGLTSNAIRVGRIAQPEVGVEASSFDEADDLRRLLLEQLGGQAGVDALNAAARR